MQGVVHHVAEHVGGQRVGHVEEFGRGPVRCDDAPGPDSADQPDREKRAGCERRKALAKGELLHE